MLAVLKSWLDRHLFRKHTACGRVSRKSASIYLTCSYSSSVAVDVSCCLMMEQWRCLYCSLYSFCFPAWASSTCKGSCQDDCRQIENLNGSDSSQHKVCWLTCCVLPLAHRLRFTLVSGLAQWFALWLLLHHAKIG